jgi:outer membrane protein insertion porin family
MSLVRRLIAFLPAAILFLASAQLCPLGAQDRRFEGTEVTNIQFDPVNQPLESEELHDILPLKMHAPLRMADVRASIASLFATGRYADIQVDAKPYQNGVAVTFVTKDAWFIGDISVRGQIPALPASRSAPPVSWARGPVTLAPYLLEALGRLVQRLGSPGLSSPPNAGQLENSARLDLGTPFTPEKLQQAVAGQRALLESNGLFQSGVEPSLDYETDRAVQQVNIRFDVESGRRATFGPPTIAGDPKMDPGRILAAAKFRSWLTHSWKPVTQTRIRQALEGVRTVYQRENRLEARVTLESIRYDAASNRAIPTLRIDAGPRIQLSTIGAKVSAKKLQSYIPVFEEHSVDRDLLVEGARNLTDYFQGQGYFEAQVQFKQQRVINDRAAIDYLINTGSRHALVAIEIAGNKYFSTEALRERMYLRAAQFLLYPHGRYSESFLRHDENAIVDLYRSNGFRDAKVTHRLTDGYRGRPGDIAVFLDVDEGPQYLVETLDIEGADLLNKADVLSRLSSTPGQPFSEFNVALDRDAILARSFDRGFAAATFEWSFAPAEQPYRVKLRYAVNLGKGQVVRQVVATGLRVTRPSLVYRNIGLSPGDPLSPTAITDTQRRLYELGVFAKVDAAIQDPDGETTRKYVLYNVEEARRYSVAAGFGAELGRIGGCQSCFAQPAGTTGFSPRVSLDVTRSNMWGLAHSLSLRTRFSVYDQRGILNYSWRRFANRPNLNVSFTGLDERSRDIRTFNSRREEGSVQLSQKVSKATTLFYRFTYRRVSVSDLKISQFLLSQTSQQVRVGMPSLNVIQDRRDDPVEPHRGIYNTLDVGQADRVFGSQVSFFRTLARNATYHPLGRRLVLARSTEVGIIRAIRITGNQLDAIPLPERFFGGGGTSDRGFAENQAGPRDPETGFPLGGTALFFNQTELRFPVFGENIGGVLFHDAGNIYSSVGNFSFRTNQHGITDFNYMVHAVGLGLRYRTPVGPLRADVAYAINPPYFFGVKSNATQQELLNAGQNPCSPPAGQPNICQVQNSGHIQFVISIGQTF